MIDNPMVNARLKWMIDPGFVMTTCYTIVSRDGAAGQHLHGGWFYGAGHTYHFQNGQTRTEQVNIGWLLQDVETATGDGGLMLVPGSHKARRPLPPSAWHLPRPFGATATDAAFALAPSNELGQTATGGPGG